MEKRGDSPALCMTAHLEITDTHIQDAITHAVQNVCRVLVHHEARLVERLSAEAVEASQAKIEVMGNVGFVGDIDGIVYLCMCEEFAAYAVGEILGMSPAEVQGEGPGVLKDAIGEVTNMTVGGFKNALCDLGFPCKLTLPTIVRGQKLKAGAIKGASRHVFRFECSGRPLIADIQLKHD
ncbi:MAG: chemotaxis protein CheX [Devosia sp.]